MEGAGVTDVDGVRMAWKRGDTVVVPTWNVYEHSCSDDAMLFCLSDEPLMRALKYYREQISS
jgi:gentisate 1,2-dioxygenase